ncbi:hypothetical protein, partial [uncultured Tateyamaria sp.]|uniref:hypothetical protein n=1 Tax=uncultured Tateyamaria sp. TaxID=455651 RepID=UPI00260FAD02
TNQTYRVTLERDAIALILKTADEHQPQPGKKAPLNLQKIRAAQSALNHSASTDWHNMPSKGGGFKSKVASAFIQALAPSIINPPGRAIPHEEKIPLLPFQQISGSWQGKLREGVTMSALTEAQRTVEARDPQTNQTYHVTLERDAIALILKTADEHQPQPGKKAPLSTQKVRTAVSALNHSASTDWHNMPSKERDFRRNVASAFIQALAPSITNPRGRAIPHEEKIPLLPFQQISGSWQGKLREGVTMNALTEAQRTVEARDPQTNQTYRVTLERDAIALILKTADEHQPQPEKKAPLSTQKVRTAVSALNHSASTDWHNMPSKGGGFKSKVASAFIQALAPSITNPRG